MNFDRLYTVILGPHVSEKAAMLGDANNQYVFKVARSATKLEIKKGCRGSVQCLCSQSSGIAS